MDTKIIRRDAEIQNFLAAKVQAGGISQAVAEEVLADQPEDIEAWFRGLSQHGCVSGWVGSLIWYSDTHAFFDKHYDEIEELREDWEDSVGEPLTIKGDLKNFLAWFAFEEVAYQMAEELGFE